MMGLPPVVVGLIVYLLISRSGPFGWLGILYTPTAMIIAQVILVTPIIVSLSCQIIEDLQEEKEEVNRVVVVEKESAERIFGSKSKFCNPP